LVVILAHPIRIPLATFSGDAMTRIDDELRINAKNLRQRAKRVEAAWREAKHITRLSAKRSAEAKAGHRAERRAAKQMERHRDRQLGTFGAASPVRVIKPPGKET
jgi:hypothetical protein